MKGTCQKCGQRISVSAEDQPGGRVMLCPDCGLPVRVTAHKRPVQVNILLVIVFILMFISLGAGIYYTACRVKATSAEPYVVTPPDKIVYLAGFSASVLGLGLGIISMVLSIIDRHWSRLALVLNSAMAVAWIILWWYILYAPK